MPILLFPKSDGPSVALSVSMTFTEPTRSLVFTSPFPPAPTIAQFGLDVDGDSEQTSAAYDFKAFAEIVGGDTLVSSPAPVIQVVLPNGDGPELEMGSVTVNGTRVQVASVSLTEGTIGDRYKTTCRVWTAAGRQLIVYGDYVLIGPS